MEAQITYELILEGRQPERSVTPQPYFVGDIIRDRWRVAQIVPIPEPPPDYEVYANRIRRCYAVNDVKTGASIGSHMTDELPQIGDIILIGVEHYRVLAVRTFPSADLLDGVLAVIRTT